MQIEHSIIHSSLNCIRHGVSFACAIRRSMLPKPNTKVLHRESHQIVGSGRLLVIYSNGHEDLGYCPMDQMPRRMTINDSSFEKRES